MAMPRHQSAPETRSAPAMQSQAMSLVEALSNVIVG